MDTTEPSIDPDRLLSPDEFAELIGVTRSTVDGWRRAGKGPPAVYLTSQTIRYRRRDVVAWTRSRREVSNGKISWLRQSPPGLDEFSVFVCSSCSVAWAGMPGPIDCELCGREGTPIVGERMPR